MKGFMGGFYGVSEWIMRFSVINLLWFFFNFPIVLIVVNSFIMTQPVSLFILLTPIGLLAPFLFFPATAAMFASVRDWILERESNSLIKAYWKYYKENYKKSMLAGLLFTGIWAIWVADYYYLSQNNIIFMFVFLLLGIVLFTATLNFFSLLAHYQMSLRSLLKNTLVVTLGSPLLLITVAIGSGIILYGSVNGPWFLIPFFSGSLIAFISFSAFYRLYVRLTEGSSQE